MGRPKYWNGTAWIDIAPSASEFDAQMPTKLDKTGGSIDGFLNVYNPSGREVIAGDWVDLSSNESGTGLLGQNCYTSNANDYRFSNTHGSMGARGIRFNAANNSLEYFDTGPMATTAGTLFTPVWKKVAYDADDLARTLSMGGMV